MATATFRIWRGDATKGEFKDYTAEVGEGMVVLDAVHQIEHRGAGMGDDHGLAHERHGGGL